MSIIFDAHIFDATKCNGRKKRACRVGGVALD